MKSFGKVPFIGETDGRKSKKMAHFRWAFFFSLDHFEFLATSFEFENQIKLSMNLN
jgi:hypothetical protein